MSSSASNSHLYGKFWRSVTLEPLQHGWSVLETVCLFKCLNDEGALRWAVRSSDGLSDEEVMGALVTYTERLRIRLVSDQPGPHQEPIASGKALYEAMEVVAIDGLPSGWIPMEVVCLLSCLDADGNGEWTVRHSPGLSSMELLGGLTIQLELLKHDVVASWIEEDDD
jgi:hypothetical protein